MSTPPADVVAPPQGGALSLAGFVNLVLGHWVVVAVATVLAAAAATALAFWMKPVYRAEVVLSPNEGQGSGGALAQVMGRMGSLGALAGLPFSTGSSSRNESIAILKSRALSENFIRTHDLLPQLYADDWSTEQARWLTGHPPTLSGAVEDFNEKVRFVFEDRRTGLVTLRIEWYEPEVAAAWANEFVAAANEVARRRAIEEAERTLKYLYDELAKTSVVGIQEGIYSLIETQINTIAVANVQSEYALRVVDPAVASDPDRFVRPIRPLVIAFGALVGFSLGVLFVLVRRGPAPRREAGRGG